MSNNLYTYLILAFGIVFCSPDNQNDENLPVDYKVIVAFPKLDFQRPVDFQCAKDQTHRLFVVEQAGIIYVFPNESETSSKKVFLDIRSKVDDSGNEEGLLGLAFHPNYKSNGFFYVNYTASSPNRTIISRFKVSSINPDVADAGSEIVLLTYSQPYSNHNGGQLSFGPDGFLYIAVGDGGSGGDPHDHGQNKSTLLGSILRIDINKQENGNQYGIPPDNPFANSSNGSKPEIFAYGLRNPWRFSFDKATNKLWTGDVGQNAYEEIDIIEKGGNYGWNTMEGKHCYSPSSGCSTTGLTLPVWEYDRSEGVSITGGFVYRGALLKSLIGKYVYADYGSRKIWALDASVNPFLNTELLTADFNISSFGVDENDELYMCAFDGKIYRLATSP